MTVQEAIDVLFNEWKCIDRNDGIHCDRKCETCDLVMDVGIIREAFNMAISALQAQELSKNSTKLDKENGELVTDCISRQAAKKAYCKSFCHPGVFCPDGLCKEVNEAFDAVPSAQPEPQWIPVSERLPEEDHWLGGSGKQFSDNVLISITNREDADAWSDISQTIDGEWGLELPRYCKITAWMPLPEPYRAERRIDGRD